MASWAMGLHSAPRSAEGQTLTKGWTVQDVLDSWMGITTAHRAGATSTSINRASNQWAMVLGKEPKSSSICPPASSSSHSMAQQHPWCQPTCSASQSLKHNRLQ